MSTEDYNFWNLIINSFTAIGTVGAVIVALHLARNKSKPNLKVTFGSFFAHPTSMIQDEGVCIAGTNMGQSKVIVSQVGFAYGMKPHFHAMIILSGPYAFTMPKTLESGEEFSIRIPFSKFNTSTLQTIRKRRNEYPWYIRWRIRMGVKLTTGEVFTAPLWKDHYKYIRS